MERARLIAASVAVSRLPPGALRLTRREELLAAVERTGDLGAVASVLLDLAWDHHSLGNTAAETTALARAWQIRQARPEVFDARLCVKVRLVFPAILEGLVRRRDLPRREIDRLSQEMEAFYRSGGYSLRAVHRGRFLIHRLHGEQEAAEQRLEAMLSEPGDVHSFCDSFYHYVAALWFERRKDWERATQECRAMLAGVAACQCRPPHIAHAHSELMYCLLELGRTQEARAQREVAYPLVRGQARLWRHVMQHLLVADRIRDVEYGMQVVQDHIGWLSARDGKTVGERWLLGMVALRFLGRLEAAGGGERTLKREAGASGEGGAGGECEVVTVAQLRAEVDAELTEDALKRDTASGEGKFQRLLDKYRYKPGRAARQRAVVAGGDGDDGDGEGEAAADVPGVDE